MVLNKLNTFKTSKIQNFKKIKKNEIEKSYYIISTNGNNDIILVTL
jgi:hypothetical protein